MNVIVIGLGSMGKRRIRLISKYDNSIRVVGVDLNKERQEEAAKELGIETCDSVTDAYDKYGKEMQAAFVCTSPVTHAKIISECLEKNLNIFTELNLLSNDYQKNIDLAKKNKCLLFLSSTFLYREEIDYIRKRVNELSKQTNYIYHIGQYLPDWHPWESYKNFFVSHPQTNGCREILAIELPWIVDTFGDIESVVMANSKMSDLEIDYKDSYNILIQHSSGNRGVLVVDVVSRNAVRNLEIINEECYIKWNGNPDSLEEYDCETKETKRINLYKKAEQLDNYSSFIVENAYYNEVRDFFDCMINKKKPKYSFEKDYSILHWIDKIEEGD